MPNHVIKSKFKAKATWEEGLQVQLFIAPEIIQYANFF